MKLKQGIITGLSVMLALFLYLNCSYMGPENGKTETERDNSELFVRSSFTLGNTRSFGIASGDVDGDSDPDIILGQIESSGGNAVYINQSIIPE